MKFPPATPREEDATGDVVAKASAGRTVQFWLVEDSEATQKLVRSWINSQQGWRCSEIFSDAQSFIDALEKKTLPDLILLDLGLPDLSGQETLRQVRSLVGDLPMVVLSAHTREQEVLEALEAGANGYLVKGTTRSEFLNCVRDALAGGAPLHPLIGKILLEKFHRNGEPGEDGGGEESGLSPREQEALVLLADGLAKKEIADRLELSIHTVDTYIRGIYRKLDVRSKTEAVAKAFRENLV